jgi:hypothetical protein
VTIDFASALRGATLELQPQGQGGIAGDGAHPAGADEGSRVRIAGQGGPSPNGGAKGDLVLTLHVTPHPQFRREGDDLHLDLPVTIGEAYHGARVPVPTVDGSVSPEGARAHAEREHAAPSRQGREQEGRLEGTSTCTSSCRSPPTRAPRWASWWTSWRSTSRAIREPTSTSEHPSLSG